MARKNFIEFGLSTCGSMCALRICLKKKKKKKSVIPKKKKQKQDTLLHCLSRRGGEKAATLLLSGAAGPRASGHQPPTCMDFVSLSHFPRTLPSQFSFNWTSGQLNCSLPQKAQGAERWLSPVEWIRHLCRPTPQTGKAQIIVES